MSSLRFLSIAARQASPFSVTRRGYAEVSDKLKLSLVLPHQVRLSTLCTFMSSRAQLLFPVGNFHVNRCRSSEHIW